MIWLRAALNAGRYYLLRRSLRVYAARVFCDVTSGVRIMRQRPMTNTTGLSAFATLHRAAKQAESLHVRWL
jgi:hypothetical protein